MCGIAGLFGIRSSDTDLLGRMAGELQHRGPDDAGVWRDVDAGVALVHRRLAVVDLSVHGHQPMTSSNGRFVLCFNGEIYNHSSLRASLDARGAGPRASGLHWRGQSDTETLVECIAVWGLETTLEKCVGMFALALWDRRERRLFLARDRFGEKPLYYGWANKDFVFASELKAVRAHPGFDGEIDRQALRLFAARTYIPAPFSIYKSMFKLEPGCILEITPECVGARLKMPPQEGTSQGGLSLHRYWSYGDVVRTGLQQPIGDERDALEQLEKVLAKAIQDQSIADVPVGAFLSGGIDSSTIVALYQKYSSAPVRTFSIGFEEAGFNEAVHARAVARQLGTVHNERYVTVKEAQDVIPLLPVMYDEPFADSSQIPTYLVSRFAREQVTVALTGDGGDELFAGYNRHFVAPHLWRQMSRVPRPLRSVIGWPLSRLATKFWDSAASLLPGHQQPHLGAKIQKTLRLAGSVRNLDELYVSFLDEWSLEKSPVLGDDHSPLAWDMDCGDNAPETVRMMYCDAVSYLPDDILCKVDRASMAVSLETRVPFLDHRVAELAARIPLSMKVRNGQGKHILRQLLYREAPRQLFERSKAGFAVPIGDWLKGPLRPWAEDLLAPSRMRAEGWFDSAIVQRRWSDHLSGRRSSVPALWAVLIFQSWLRQQGQELSAAA